MNIEINPVLVRKRKIMSAGYYWIFFIDGSTLSLMKYMNDCDSMKQQARLVGSTLSRLYHGVFFVPLFFAENFTEDVIEEIGIYRYDSAIQATRFFPVFLETNNNQASWDAVQNGTSGNYKMLSSVAKEAVSRFRNECELEDT